MLEKEREEGREVRKEKHTSTFRLQLQAFHLVDGRVVRGMMDDGESVGTSPDPSSVPRCPCPFRRSGVIPTDPTQPYHPLFKWTNVLFKIIITKPRSLLAEGFLDTGSRWNFPRCTWENVTKWSMFIYHSLWEYKWCVLVLLLMCCCSFNMLVWFWPLYQHTIFPAALVMFIKIDSHWALMKASRNFQRFVSSGSSFLTKM